MWIEYQSITVRLLEYSTYSNSDQPPKNLQNHIDQLAVTGKMGNYKKVMEKIDIAIYSKV